MKKPTNYALKKWINERTICGLKIIYYQTGVDTSDTDWELSDCDGNTKRIKEDVINRLVTIAPDWASILSLKPKYVDELLAWEEFSKKEHKDLQEYERLKRKFGSNDSE